MPGRKVGVIQSLHGITIKVAVQAQLCERSEAASRQLPQKRACIVAELVPARQPQPLQCCEGSQRRQVAAFDWPAGRTNCINIGGSNLQGGQPRQPRQGR